jgi:hypothetical protein
LDPMEKLQPILAVFADIAYSLKIDSTKK